MNIFLKATLTGIALTSLVIGSASAMTPKYSLNQNLFSDDGASIRILSDIDKGAWHIRQRIESGLSDFDYELKPPTKLQFDLLGKQ